MTGATPLFASAVTRHHQLRAEWLDMVEALYLRAEKETRGHMLNRRGRALGIDARSLFYGSEIRATAYASDELREHWLTNGRLPYRAFIAAVAGDACPTCGGVSA